MRGFGEGEGLFEEFVKERWCGLKVVWDEEGCVEVRKDLRLREDD